MKTDRSASKTRLLLILSTLVLTSLLIFLFIQIRSLINTGDTVNHVNRISASLHTISTSLLEAESSQRGFLLSNDELLLSRRELAFDKLYVQLGLLDSLVADNPYQSKNLSELHELINRKLLSMSNVLNLYRKDQDIHQFQDSVRVGIVLMENVRQSLRKMASTEENILKNHTTNFTRISFATSLLYISLCVLALAFLIFSNFRLIKSLTESHQLQEELSKEKGLLDSILNSTLDLISVYDKDKRFLYYSQACELLFGKSKDEIIGKKLEEVFPSTVNGQGFSDLNKSLTGETIHNTLYYSPLWDRYYENFLTPLKDEDGQVYAALVVAHDITDLHLVNEKINKSNQALEEAQRLANVGSWEWSPVNGRLIWSPHLHSIYGIDRNEQVDFEKFSSLLHPEDKERVLSIIAASMESGASFEFIHRIVTDNKKVKYIYAKGECDKDEDSKVIRMRGTGQDITQQKKNESLLLQSEDKFNKLFQLSPFSISLSELDGRYIDVNENFIKTYGYEREELIGRTSLELNLIEAEMQRRIHEELRYSGTIRNVEITVQKKNGEHIPVLVSIEKVQIANKEYYLTAMIDIAERKRAEEKIEQANFRLQRMNKELESFAYVSSHDLQEPLRKIRTYSSRLLEKEYENISENGREQFRRIQNAAGMMQTLIEDLLSYSKTTLEDQNLEHADLRKFTLDVLDDFSEEFLAIKGSFTVAGNAKAEIIPFQFRQMLYNLISNAIKFSSPLRPLKLEIIFKEELNRDQQLSGHSPDTKVCCIEIKDNGIGFEKEFSEKIFEVFQRLHGKDRYVGTGIGLAIVKKIIENHNGRISAQGDLEQGSTFEICIPA